MKYITLLLLCLPLFAFAADHGGAAAETKAPVAAPATEEEADSAATGADEHAGDAAEHAGAPAEEKE